MGLTDSIRCSAGELSQTRDGWPIERLVSLLAGGVTLTSLGLGRTHDPRWRILTGLVGANLVLQATAGWCPASVAMRMAGMRAAGEAGWRAAGRRAGTASEAEHAAQALAGLR